MVLGRGLVDPELRRLGQRALTALLARGRACEAAGTVAGISAGASAPNSIAGSAIRTNGVSALTTDLTIAPAGDRGGG